MHGISRKISQAHAACEQCMMAPAPLSIVRTSRHILTWLAGLPDMCAQEIAYITVLLIVLAAELPAAYLNRISGSTWRREAACACLLGLALPGAGAKGMCLLQVNNAGIQRRIALAEDPDWAPRQLEIDINCSAPGALCASSPAA